MAINLNADVGQIFREFLSKKSQGKDNSGDGKQNDGKQKSTLANLNSKKSVSYKDVILKSILVLCFLLAILWYLNDVSNNPIAKNESEFTSNSQLEEEYQKLLHNIVDAKVMLENNKQKSREILPEFSNIEGSKQLFDLISSLSGKNNLISKNLLKGRINAVNKPIDYFKNTLNLEFEGNFSNYIEFKRQLQKNKPILTILEEKIILRSENNSNRKLAIFLTIDDYSLDKSKYEKIINQ